MPTASSPGKIILTGEHAVLTGAPALVMATAPRVTCDALPHSADTLTLSLPDRPSLHLSGSDLRPFLQQVKDRHQMHLALERPEDLLIAAALQTDVNWRGALTYHTHLPLGSGMGASAAFLLATIRALSPDLHSEALYSKALELEHLQHGTSSGLDLWASLHGGIWWVEGQTRTRLSVTQVPEFQIFHTGTPTSTTGECVQHVQQHFPTEHSIWQTFREVAEETRQAIDQQDASRWEAAIRENQNLLATLGVVPPSVHHVLCQLNEQGAAAKVCGAGSIRGETAGVVLLRKAPPELIPTDWIDIGASFDSLGTQ